jgi:hypothetical protein
MGTVLALFTAAIAARLAILNYLDVRVHHREMRVMAFLARIERVNQARIEVGPGVVRRHAIHLMAQ